MAEGSGAAAAQSYRQDLRSKAERLAKGEDARDVDASSFEPAEKLYAGVKTGMRPVSRQARKDGGQVVGKCAGGRADRPGRKAGGGVGESYINRNQKTADEDREGHYPNGGMKKGGRAHKAGGGLGALGGVLPMAIGALEGDGDGDDQKPAKAGGGYIAREGGPSETRELRKKSASGAVHTDGRPAAEDGRQGRASGGRVSRQAGGPLATPLAAGMGGQGRMSFNFPQNRAQMLERGGRAVAHERYGAAPGPAEHHPGMADRKARAAGGSVEKKVLAAHHAEHEAMKEGRKDGGRAPAGPPDDRAKRAVAAIPERSPTKVPFNLDDTMSAARYQRGHNKAGGKAGHGKDCECPRCAARKAKGGLLKDWDAKQRADGGRAERAKGGSTYGTQSPLRLVSSHGSGDRTAKVYKDPDWGEYRVRHYEGGVHQPKADYHTDDRSDAVDTANAWSGGKAAGGRAGRAKGGKAGTKINIVIAPGGANGQPPMGAMPPGGPLGPLRAPTPPVLPPGAPPGMGAAAGPPAGMPMPPGGGGPPPPMPPMPPRKRGGRVKAGAGSGLGRLQKTRAYGEPPGKGQSV